MIPSGGTTAMRMHSGIKEVPEVTAKGMAQVEQLFSELDADEQAVQ
jgi:hypothetical protein